MMRGTCYWGEGAREGELEEGNQKSETGCREEINLEGRENVREKFNREKQQQKK